MSWKTVNEIIGQAAIDKDFAQILLQDPLTAIDSFGYNVSNEERAMLGSIQANNLDQFCQQLIHLFVKEPLQDD